MKGVVGEGAFGDLPGLRIGKKQDVEGVGIVPWERCQRVFDQRRDR